MSKSLNIESMKKVNALYESRPSFRDKLDRLINNEVKKEIIQDKNIRLCYFMVQTNKGIGYICVALKRPAKDSDSNVYRAGFSFCSPQEGKKFSKSKARAMAMGRLATFNRNQTEVTDRTDRLEFGWSAKNLTEVFSKSLEIAEQCKVTVLVNTHGKEEFVTKWFVPNWVRNRKGLVFGLNMNSESTEKAQKA